MFSRVDSKQPRKYRRPAPRKLFAWCSVWGVVGLLLTFVLFADNSGTLANEENIRLQSGGVCNNPALRNAFEENDIDVFLCKGDDGYEKASRIWNMLSQRDPLGVVRPRNEKEIGAILKTAMQHGFAVTVKGGGHSPAGWGVEEDAILIDMSRMKRIKVDPEEKVLWAEGGAIWDDVVPLMEKHSLAYVGGECPSVGIVGVALGGGTGWLSRDRGLISDNIISLNLALPNGSFVEVSSTKHPELLWALSGAGHSNFGVVTSIRFRLHDAQPEYFAGNLCFSVADGMELRKFGRVYAQSIGKITDNRLTIYLVLRRGSGLGYGVCYTLFFNGPKEEGPKAAEPLLTRFSEAFDETNTCTINFFKICPDQKGKATPDQVEKMKSLILSGRPFKKGVTFARFARAYGGPSAYMFWKSGVLNEISIEVMDALVDGILDPEMKSLVDGDLIQIQINHNGGAISEKPSDHSSFPFRKSGFVAAMHGILSPPPNSSSPDKARNLTLHDWATRTHQKLSPFFVGAYSNYNDREQRDWKSMYYGKNVEKLEKIKKSIEGHEVFRTFQRL
ncbi:hypothetical protein BSKO_12143 [Bryopsis sp. KO-2023]|nr:hypothetical protein BSKO_12143 [Bryopsis sp. KO-2023]